MTLPGATAITKAGSLDDRWSAGVFGMHLRGDFDAPGLAGSRVPAGAPPVEMSAIAPDLLESEWDWSGSERVLHWRVEDDSQVVTIDRHPSLGYRFGTNDRGDYVIAADGSRILIAPPRDCETWWWQRYLIGQVLPVTAVLNGFESLHSSAVSVDGNGLAFLAASGVGKTSLAINLILRGAEFVTDDVVALRRRGDALAIHPGPPLTSIRHAECERLGERQGRLGARIGGDDSGVRVEIARAEQPVPLRAVYLLERTTTDDAEPTFTRVEPDLRSLVIHSFDFLVATPRRRLHQLDVCAQVARDVHVARVAIPPRVDAALLAEHVERHLADVVA